MIALDTNILARYLLNDDPGQTAKRVPASPPVYPYDLHLAPPVQSWPDDQILFLQLR